jgi:hypothetical protein
MAFSSKNKPQVLLKSYIDAQLLLLRVEKLRRQVSTDILNENEVKELNSCIQMVNSSQEKNKVVDDVSEEGNAKIIRDVISLLESVKAIDDSRRKNAAGKAELNRGTNTVPVQVQATGVWLRYKCDGSEKHYFYNNVTKEVVWVLPVGATSIDSDDPEVMWETEARFQIINPYLVS